MMMLIYLTWDFIFMDIHFFHAYVLFFMHMHNSLYTILPYHDLRHLHWQYEQFQLIPWKQDIHIDQSVGMHTLKRNTKVPDRKKIVPICYDLCYFCYFYLCEVTFWGWLRTWHGVRYWWRWPHAYWWCLKLLKLDSWRRIFWKWWNTSLSSLWVLKWF